MDRSVRSYSRFAKRATALAAAALVLTSCGSWKGIANVPLPTGAGTGRGAMTVHVQMPNTLALNVNSPVRVADIEVGSVRDIELNDWVATLTLGLNPNVVLPANAVAKIGQTSLLGSQHVELAAPENPSPTPLKSGDTIALKNSSAFPTTEQVLASFALLLRGGGIPNLKVIQNEIYNVVTGRADDIRDFLGRLDTFTGELNQQSDDITRAIDSTNELLTIAAQRSDTLDRVLTEFPPLVEHFADTRDRFGDAIEALGRTSKAVDAAVAPASEDLHTNLELLQRPLCELGKASPYVVGALNWLITFPFHVDSVPKIVRGDYINASLTVDLTLSALDNTLLTGTGFSGALRALEQSWGRDPATMIPDIRFTPNALDAPGGPLVQRGNGIC